MTRASILLLLLVAFVGAARAEALTRVAQLLDEGRYDLVVQLEGPRLIETHPDNPEAYFLYSRALYLVGDIAGAREKMAQALDLSETPPLAYRWLDALILADEGQHERSYTSLAELFDEAPSYLLAMDWGRVAWQAGAYEEAITAFKEAQALEAGRAEPWPYLNEARLLGYQGRYQEAVFALQTAIDIMDATDTPGDLPPPAYVEAYYLLGEAYESLGLWEDARANYFGALSSDPLHQPSLQALNRLNEREP